MSQQRSIRSARTFVGHLAGIAAILILLAGCVAPKPPADPDRFTLTPAELAGQSRSTSSTGTQVVTNLDKISDADTAALAPKLTDEAPAPVTPPADRNLAKNEVLTEKLAANAPTTRWDAPVSKLKGGSRLLNDKARQYANFAQLLLNQTLSAAQTMAPTKLAQHRVPDDLEPTTLTAVMDPQGRLKEIIIEQHSGDLAVDKLFIEACKKGIWSRNPPPGARASDGSYRVRIEGTVYNTSYDRYGQYNYDTELGLGIL